jgi:hypothetical protein
MKKAMVVLTVVAVLSGLGACTVTTSGHVRGEISTSR